MESRDNSPEGLVGELCRDGESVCVQLTDEFGAAVRSHRTMIGPAMGIAIMKLTTVTQVTVDRAQTTDPEVGR